jgi:type I restriction enzyme, S subunit
MTLYSFHEILTDRTSTYHKIDKGSYLPEGLYRIIDQGKADIAGFTNDETLVVDRKRPIIIFGDHTRILKYVDFPIAIGADGVKVLHVSDRAIPKYVYYYLKSIRLPDAGYSRHFKFLKNVKIPIIALEDQIRIATVLSKAEALITQREESIRLLNEFLKSTFLDMFGDPIRNERKFDHTTLIKLIDQKRGISYGIVQRGNNVDEGVPVVRIRDVEKASYKIDDFVRTSPVISNKYKRTILRGGELLISIRGTVGKLSIAPPQTKGWNISREVAIIPVTANINELFLLHLLKSEPIQKRIAGDIKGVAQSGINLTDLRQLKIILPPVETQIKFAKVCENVEAIKKQLQESLLEIENLFNSLNQSAFKGELGLKNFEVAPAANESLVEKVVDRPIKKGKQPKIVRQHVDPFEGKTIPEDRLMTLTEAKKILGNEFEEISKERQSHTIDSAWLQARTLPVSERGSIKFNSAEGWAILDSILFERDFGFTSNEFMVFLQKEGIAFDSDTIANFFSVALDKKRIVQRYSKNIEVEIGRTDSSKEENIIWFAHNVVDK